MSDSLILNPTETSQWHALVNEAQVESSLYLEEDIESYLVFLLMRFSQSADLSESVLAIDFLESNEILGKAKIEKLQAIGDKSLLFSGLFPGLAERKHVSLSYFISMGTTAYHSVARLETRHGHQLFTALGEGFQQMTTVLNKIQTPASD